MIAYYNMIREMRDRKTLAIMLLMPIVLIFILGTALDSQFTPNGIGKTSVAYINMDQGEASQIFEEFLKIEEIQELLEIKPIQSYEEGERLLKEKTVSAVLWIDQGYSQQIQKGEKGTLRVITNKNRSFRMSIVQNIVDSFLNSANTQEALRRLGRAPSIHERGENIEKIAVSAEGTIPRAIDYYAVTMLVMILLYGTFYGCHGLGEDLFTPVGKRIQSTSLPFYQMFIGKTVGMIGTLFLQAIILIVFTRYVYQVNWGNQIGLILWICFSMCVMTTGIGMLVCTGLKDSHHGSYVLNIVIPIFTFLSGGYVKIVTDNSTFHMVRFLIPNQLGHTALFNTIYNGSMRQIQQSIGIMWVIIGLVFIATICLERRYAR